VNVAAYSGDVGHFGMSTDRDNRGRHSFHYKFL
jgi:hypothetical protein